MRRMYKKIKLIEDGTRKSETMIDDGTVGHPSGLGAVAPRTIDLVFYVLGVDVVTVW